MRTAWYRSLGALLLASTLPAQAALFLRDGNLVAWPLPGAQPRQVLEVLLAGPPEAGLGTAIPPGTRLLALVQDGARVRLTLDHSLLRLLGTDALEHALEQIAKTALDATGARAVEILVRDTLGRVRPIDEFQAALERVLARRAGAQPPPTPPLAPSASAGALSGRTIFVSPGHGYYWSATLNRWTTQRGTIDGTIEDLHTHEICMDFVLPALENLGARVVVARERGRAPDERIVNDDQGAPGYTETGTWAQGAGSGWSGSGYRYAFTSPLRDAVATFQVAVPRDGHYGVQAFWSAGTNRAADARFTIHHSGGSTEVRVDQTRDDRRWVWLGEYWFTQAQGARVSLDNQGAVSGRVVVADAVRLGAGAGSIPRGTGTSGRPRWQEAARYWTQYVGAPSSVYVRGTGSDDGDDVTCRPAYAEWQGADAYLSLHTNAGGGAGTETFVYSGGATAGSTTLQGLVQGRLIQDIRAEYDPAWVDRGLKSANFGEVRVLSSMPGVLVELAFHDTPGSRDLNALHDPRFRYVAGRALARAVMRYFAPAAPFAPEAPVGLRVQQDGQRGLRVAWEPVAGATLYAIETAPDGKGFLEAAQVASTSWSTGPLPPGTLLSFRVRALNASGRSFPSEVLCAGTAHTGAADLLLVNGFDRLDRYVKPAANTRDYLSRHGEAIRRAGEFSLAFDAASNEALLLGRVALGGYRAVDWALGEESTRDETFSAAEQTLVAAYLDRGGRLLVSGAELAWDLDANGSAQDRAFLHGVLGVRYVADDAGTRTFADATGGIFQGLGPGAFDDGTQGTYDVDYPDVLAPADASGRVCLVYTPAGTGAGIERAAGNARVVTLGFPLETVVNHDLRARLMARALRFLLAPRALEAPAEVALGSTAPLVLHVPGEAGRPYVLLASFGLGPGIGLPGGGVLPLQPDGLFSFSLLPGNGVFLGFQGALDGQGRASAGFFAPALPLLRGVPFHFSGFTIASASPPVEGVLLPWARVTPR
ncbi:MAG: N-acetylmuramoyl-L-alanine amidase [Planctomycetes bacterium]|nr:N-acetylmuramoyl-L-alanine amidase [Planctomycetota bacterium]